MRIVLMVVGVLTSGVCMALEVARVTPSGENVSVGHQIVVEFDRDVVPLGVPGLSPALAKHIKLAPQLACQWRWLNPNTLACQLDGANGLQSGTAYEMRIEEGFGDLDGAVLGRDFVSRFETERPRATWARFERWLSPGKPVIRLRFNQAVTKASVARAVRLQAQGRYLGARVSVENWQHDNEPAVGEGDDIARSVWLVTPNTDLPPDRKLRLVVKRGLRGAVGELSGERHEPELELHSFGEFRFLGVRCYEETGGVDFGANDSAATQCNPGAGFALNFSSPVNPSSSVPAVAMQPKLDPDGWSQDYDRLRYAHRADRVYTVHWHGSLEPKTRYRLQITQPDRVEDVFGRRLAEPVSIEFSTGHRQPLLELAHTDAVLEAGIDSELAVQVLNVADASVAYRAVSSMGVSTGKRALEIPAGKDVAHVLPLGVRKLVGGNSGFVTGHLQSAPQAGLSQYQRSFTAQITPYQVLFKLGHFRSLVWVTDLATGEPVADADVRLFRGDLERYSIPPDNVRTYRTDSQGLAVLPGAGDLDPLLEGIGWRCAEPCKRWVLQVDGTAGMAVLPVTYDYQLSLWRTSNYALSLNQNQRYGHLRAWGTTAQGVYRPGDTVKFKYYVRNQRNETWTAPPHTAFQLKIEDPTGKTIHESAALTLNEFGAADGSVTLPATSTMGWYRAVLSAPLLSDDVTAFDFLVTDFTPSPFKVSALLNGDRFDATSVVRVRTQASLHSGGPYGAAAVRSVLRLRPTPISFTHPLTRSFQFDSGPQDSEVELMREDGELSAQGEHEVEFSLAQENGGIQHGVLLAESAVRDDRGKSVASMARAQYRGVQHFVGLRSERWVHSAGKVASIDVVAADGEGTPVEGVPMVVEVKQRVLRSAKVRGAGNAYLTEMVEEWVDAGRCELTSARQSVPCTFTPQHPGSYRAIVSTESGHRTELWLWVTGRGRVLWDDDNQGGVALLPEQTSYTAGDTARILVKNPLPGALALISVERYGVLRSWTQRLEGSTPIVELPIEQMDAPGVYVSVALFSPRIAAPPPTNADGGQRLDLGKPAFRVGYVALEVEDPARQLKVSAETDARTYKPGSKVALTLRAPQHTELAVVVLDEAVLDLVRGGARYFDPRAGFDGLHGVDVDNYSLLERLVGRTLFGSKGANQGGDGGLALSVRSIIDYVAYWNPGVRPDEQGRADLHFDLPDNLTGWRVLVMAVDGSHRFGLGQTQFATNLDTEIRPLTPNQVGEGDTFKAAFSVMNRTQEAREITVQISAAGDVVDGANSTNTKTKLVTLAPFERKTVGLPLRAAMLQNPGTIRFAVRAFDAVSEDALLHDMPVVVRRVAEVMSVHGSLSSDEAAAREQVKLPGRVHQDFGGLQLDISASVVGQVTEAFRYMRDYPYACWEQKLSKGVMAVQYRRLASYLDGTVAWPESAQVAAATVNAAADHQAPNGGMTYFVPMDQHVSPYLSAYTGLMLPWLASQGEAVAPHVTQRLHAYLASVLARDAFAGGYDRGSKLTVRAVAVNALARAGEVSAGEVQRLLEHEAELDVFAVANLLEATTELKRSRRQEKLKKQLTDRLLSQLNRTSGTVTLNGSRSSAVLHSSPSRDLCAVLSAVSKADVEGQEDMVTALARTVSAQRGTRGYWANTHENMFCTKALADYAVRYEGEAPDASVLATFDGRSLGDIALNTLSDAGKLNLPIDQMDGESVQSLQLNHSGEGRAYYVATTRYAPLQAPVEALNSGLSIERTYWLSTTDGWQPLAPSDTLRQGDLVKVQLDVSAPGERHFVVVDDPVAGGLEPVERSLQTASSLDSEVERGSADFYHRELGHEAVRFFADRVSAGTHRLSYTAQAIASGQFTVPGTRAEAMYDPDVFGVAAPRVVEILE